MTSIDEDHPWLNMTLREFYQFNLNEKGQQTVDDKVQEFTMDLPVDFKNDATTNAEALDKHMMFVSGGALGVIATLFTSDRFLTLCHTYPLILALIAFGLCLFSVVSSYRMAAFMHETIVTLPSVISSLFKFLKSIKEEDDKTIAAREAERKWNRVKNRVRWGIRFASISGHCNLFSYSLFVIGIFSFTIFGALNMLTVNTCSNFESKEVVQIGNKK